MSEKTIGTKKEVFFGKAKHTSGKLKKNDLMQNKSGKIISKKKYLQGKIAFKNNQLKPKTSAEFKAINAAKKKNLF
jgi:uncharacterized protein YjbJ (UPF0337 family)